MRCQQQGDLQKCLDGLIELNKKKTLWTDHVTYNILFQDVLDQRNAAKEETNDRQIILQES